MAEKQLTLADIEKGKTVAEKLGMAEQMRAQLEQRKKDLETQLKGIDQTLASLKVTVYNAAKSLLGDMGVQIKQADAAASAGETTGRPSYDWDAIKAALKDACGKDGLAITDVEKTIEDAGLAVPGKATLRKWLADNSKVVGERRATRYHL